MAVIKKHYFLLHAITGRADKLEDLILFQNCHLGTPRRAVISGKNLLGSVGSGNVQPLACGHAALKIWTKSHPVWFQAADLFRKTGSHWLCTQTHLLLKTSCSQAVAFTSGGFSIAGTAGCMPNTLHGEMERKSLLISYQLPAQAYHNHFAWIFKPIINL